MRKLIPFFLFCFGAVALTAQEADVKTPQQIEEELAQAEAKFDKAKKMFNPWYTGPLITAGSSLMPQGWGNLQPYLYVADNYARFDSHRHSHHSSSSLVSLNPYASLQFGMTKSTDILLGLQGFGNWQSHHSGGGFGDMGMTVGFLVNEQTRYTPGIKFCVSETFPTGRYQRLNTNGLGLDATGGGSFQTQFALNMSKVVFWDNLHPMNLRMSFMYKLPVKVKVHGFNNYGGGYGTHATVHPGNTFSVDGAFEISLTQRWVWATDIVYVAQNATTYCGETGTTEGGDAASLGGGFNDNLSLAPAIEYNWNENLGILGGVWFSVYGRNSSNFVTGIISITWTFQVK